MQFFPYFLPPSLSASTAREMEECPLRRILGSWVAFHGIREKSADPRCNTPEVTRQARFSKLLEGDYAWMGNLVHDFFEDSLYAEAERQFAGKSPAGRESLYSALQEKFSLGWDTSRDMDERAFFQSRHLPRGRRPVWLILHALERKHGRVIDPERDATVKEQRLEWMNRAAVVIRDNLTSLIDGVPAADWLIIEGRHPGNPPLRQNPAEEVRPGFLLTVDDQQIEIFCTIDFAYKKDDILVLSDLKTGKEKADLHRRQLELYGVFAMDKKLGFAPEKILLRLMYPQDPDGKWIREYPFGPERLEAAQKWLYGEARKILKCYVPLSHREVTLKQLQNSFSPREAENLFALAGFKRRGVWPSGPGKAQVVKFLIEKLSPPELIAGLKERVPKIEAALEGAVRRVKEACVPATAVNETVNRDMLLRVMPSQDAGEFLNLFSVQHLRVPLPSRFRENEADKWIEREEERKRGGKKERDFLPCASCAYSWFCEPGKRAVSLF